MEEELYNKERFIKEYNDIKKRAEKLEIFFVDILIKNWS